MDRSPSCNNCKHGIKKDLSVWKYRVEFKCLKNNYDGEVNFMGEGDYAGRTLSLVCCSKHEFNNEGD